eukprot:EG_transcript_8081
MCTTQSPRLVERTFKDWCAKRGMSVNGLEWMTSEKAAGGRGALATRHLRAGQKLVSVPREAVLTVIVGQPTPFPEFVSQAGWCEMPWQAQLACVLLHEKRKGANSAVAGYVETLPRKFTRAARLEPQDIQQLAYPPLERAALQEQFSTSVLAGHLEATGTLFHPAAGGITVAEFEWALDCVFSRAFGGEVPPLATPPTAVSAVGLLMSCAVAATTPSLWLQLPAALLAAAAAACLALDALHWTRGLPKSGWQWHNLFPMIDSLNHRSEPPSDVPYNRLTDSFELYAGKDVEAGEECFLSYGRHSNDDLLLGYGFVEANNPYDVYVFDSLLQDIPEFAEQPALHAVLRRDGTLDDMSREQLLTVCAGDPSRAQRALAEAVDQELAARAGLAAASGAEAALMEAFRAEKLGVLRDAARRLAEPL